MCFFCLLQVFCLSNGGSENPRKTPDRFPVGCPCNSETYRMEFTGGKLKRESASVGMSCDLQIRPPEPTVGFTPKAYNQDGQPQGAQREFPGSALESASEGAVGNRGAPESASEGAPGNRGAPESAPEGALPDTPAQEEDPREHFPEHPGFPEHPRKHFPEHPDFPQHPRKHFPEHFQGIPVEHPCGWPS